MAKKSSTDGSNSMKHDARAFTLLSLALSGALGFAVPSLALAQNQVFLNGVEISGTKNQTFTDVSVAFDAAGNISITAPQYKVVEQTPRTTGRVAPSPTQPAQVVGQIGQQTTQTTQTARAGQPQIAVATPTLPNPEKPTYMLALFNAPGLLGYNVEVIINGVMVKTIPQGMASQSFDVTQHLRRGTRNTIQYRLVMAADSGTSSKATVHISLAKANPGVGNTVELIGEYAPIEIKGIDGAKTYAVQIDIP